MKAYAPLICPSLRTDLHGGVAGRLNSALKVSVVTLTALHVVEVGDEHGNLKGGLSCLDSYLLWLFKLSNLLQGIRMRGVPDEPMTV